jgi:hypothetical protein
MIHPGILAAGRMPLKHNAPPPIDRSVQYCTRRAVGSPPACGRPLGRFVAFMTGRCARADAGWLSGPHPRAIGPDHQRPSDPITPARRSGPPLIHPNQAKAARPAGAFRRAGSRSRAGLTEDGRREQSRPSPPSPQTQVRQGREVEKPPCRAQRSTALVPVRGGWSPSRKAGPRTAPGQAAAEVSNIEQPRLGGGVQNGSLRFE